jgi:hypothetical protein
MPTPPVTTNAPFVVVVDVVLAVMLVIPDTVSNVRVPTEVIVFCTGVPIVPVIEVADMVPDEEIFPVTLMAPPIPTPPVTTSAPDEAFVDTVLAVIDV